MSTEQVFKKLDAKIKHHFIDNYDGETDIVKVLDTSHFMRSNDICGLMEEMAKQPAVYAYWSNLKRLADVTYEKIERKYEVVKAKRIKIIVESLKSLGVRNPATKVIDSKFHETYKDQEWYINFQNALSLWKKRKDELAIVEKAISAREQSFRSLSFLLSNMINKDLFIPKLK